MFPNTAIIAPGGSTLTTYSYIVLTTQELLMFYKDLIRFTPALDAIAWAFFQKYERGDRRYYDTFYQKVFVEELITERDW